MPRFEEFLDTGRVVADEETMKMIKAPGQANLVIGTLMIGGAVAMGWFQAPSATTAEVLNFEENTSTELFSIQNRVCSIRVVAGDPEVHFEIVNPDGKVIGRHCGLDSAMNCDKKSGLLMIADVSQFDPIN